MQKKPHGNLSASDFAGLWLSLVERVVWEGFWPVAVALGKPAFTRENGTQHANPK
jgi:hypothetical protein